MRLTVMALLATALDKDYPVKKPPEERAIASFARFADASDVLAMNSSPMRTRVKAERSSLDALASNASRDLTKVSTCCAEWLKRVTMGWPSGWPARWEGSIVSPQLTSFNF